MRFLMAAVSTVLGLSVVIAAALYIPGQPVFAQADGIKTQRHFKIERPADLTAADALVLYEKIGKNMARGYAASGNEAAASYRKWRRYNSAPYRSATHGNRYVNNYGNAKAARYGKLKNGDSLPQGAVLVKDSFTVTGDGDVFGGALFTMEKLAPGTRPEYADWRYVMVMPDGSLFGDSQGETAGKVAFCDGCHKAVAETDRLFFIPKPYRRVFLQDN